MRKGESKREVIRPFVKQPDPSGDIGPRVETCYRRVGLELESSYLEKSVPFAGAVETFRWLRNHKIRLATTTGFRRETSDLVLNQNLACTAMQSKR